MTEKALKELPRRRCRELLERFFRRETVLPPEPAGIPDLDAPVADLQVAGVVRPSPDHQTVIARLFDLKRYPAAGIAVAPSLGEAATWSPRQIWMNPAPSNR